MRTGIDQQTVKRLCYEIEATLKSLIEKHGVQIKWKIVNYDDSTFTVRIKVAAMQDGQISNEAADFKRYAGLHGLNEDDLGKTFDYGCPPTTYTLIGFLSHCSMFLVQDASGRRTQLDVPVVVDALWNQKWQQRTKAAAGAAADPPLLRLWRWLLEQKSKARLDSKAADASRPHAGAGIKGNISRPRTGAKIRVNLLGVLPLQSAGAGTSKEKALYQATLPDGRVVRKWSLDVTQEDAFLGCVQRGGRWQPTRIVSEPQDWWQRFVPAKCVRRCL